MAAYQIGSLHIAELGGLRGKQKPEAAPTGRFWRNKSFQNYADYTKTAAFHDGLAKLLELGASGRTAIMCAEAVWWRCHRRIIADFLLSGGDEVFPILGVDNVEAATLTTGAEAKDGQVVYPAEG